jgi:general secretion pathway protein A
VNEIGITQYPERVEEEGQIALSDIEDYSLLFNGFFGFRESPFNNTPDPHFFFMSQKHREILMNMVFGIEQRRGFIAVTGEIGAGKTTLCRQLMLQLPRETKTAVILNPNLSGTHLLATILRDFGVECKGRTKKHYFDALNEFLLSGLERHQNACIIIDESQCLSTKVLDEIRMLSNLETSQRKLLQIVLMGQPELRGILERPQLTQLRQRVSVFCHLKALDRNETRDYIEHRLQCAQEGSCEIVFDQFVINKIYETTRGIPRLINSLCDRILMAAFAGQTKGITWEVARTAFEETAFICS